MQVLNMGKSERRPGRERNDNGKQQESDLGVIIQDELLPENI